MSALEAEFGVLYPTLDRLVLRALVAAAAGNRAALAAACDSLDREPAHDARPPCRYGAACRLRTAAHRAQYVHDDDNDTAAKPAKPDSGAESTAAVRREPCAFGDRCYRRAGNAAHRAACSHPGDADWPASASADVARALARADSLASLPPSSPDASDDDADDVVVGDAPSAAPDEALLAEVTVRGVVPRRVMRSGETVLVPSASSDTTHTCKRTGSHYYCTCHAWKNQKSAVDSRTCKHLKALLGPEYEAARVSGGGDASAASGAIHTSDTSGAPAVIKVGRPDLLLAKKYEEKMDPTGYWLSEKLDGVRAYWNPETKIIVSRNGNQFMAPDWFLATLPRDMSLDGELWAGRGQFALASSIARSAGDTRWQSLTFQIFDAPSLAAPFEERLAAVGRLKCGEHVVAVAHVRCRDSAHLAAELARVEALGGEGLMLRQPGSLYVGTRSSTLLKLKSFVDTDAKVVGHQAGKGKYRDSCGALLCRLGVDGSGAAFKCGSGMTDADRSDPPPIGSVIIVRYQELTADGVPRFPTFVGIRGD